MQLPGDFLVTLTSKEIKEVLARRLKLFVKLHLEKRNAFTQNSFSSVFHILVIEPRHKKVIQEIFDQFLKDGVIESIPDNPAWFRFRPQ